MDNIQELQEKIAQYEKREKELELRVEELTDFFENASLPLHWVDGNGIIIWANQTELDLLGYTKEEYIDQPISKFHADNEVIDDILTRLTNNEVLNNYSARLICKDGAIKQVLINSNVLRKDGKIVHTRCFTRDITELKKEQDKQANLLDELKKSEKLFKSIALNIPKSLIIVIDKNHRFVSIEGDIMEKMGFNSEDYQGKHPTEIAPPERYEATKHLYDRVLKGDKFSVERKAETGEDFMVHFVPLKNDDGEVYAGLMIALEITEIKQAEEKSAKLAAIIDSSDDAIISKTLESIVTSWNDSAVRTFGYNADEMIGQSIVKLIPPDRQEEEPQILSRLKRGERVEHFETKRLTKYGKLIDVSLSISPVKDKNGHIIGLSKIARDITEKKQEEMRKNDFIAMVSHELKTPLTSIKSYVQVLLDMAKKSGNEFTINALTRADVQTRKMTSMIQDFLSLTRLEEGKIKINKEPFDLHELIEEVAGEAQFLTSVHEVVLKDCEDIIVNADKDKIGQVLINLLSNAIKYSPKGGTIVIGCKKENNKVKVYVTDEGIGINREDQKRLFERFYRVKNDKIKTVSGFGIGLYLVSEILKYHDSKIEVESREGIGSTFSFSLDMQ